MTDDLHEFEKFMKWREDAARAYVIGDFAPLGRIATRQSPAAVFGPGAGLEQAQSKCTRRTRMDPNNSSATQTLRSTDGSPERRTRRTSRNPVWRCSVKRQTTRFAAPGTTGAARTTVRASNCEGE
jgi:hypothetical protein